MAKGTLKCMPAFVSDRVLTEQVFERCSGKEMPGSQQLLKINGMS